LREVKNVKYGTFMEPGKRMEATAEIVEQGEALTVFKGRGEVEGVSAVTARLTLARKNLAAQNPAWRELDERLVAQFQARYQVLRGSYRGAAV